MSGFGLGDFGLIVGSQYLSRSEPLVTGDFSSHVATPAAIAGNSQGIINQGIINPETAYSRAAVTSTAKNLLDGLDN
jgi:hypothetical protein